VKVDSFRYVVENPGLLGNSGGRVFIVSRDLARGVPCVAIGPEDITVVVWPVAAPVGATGSAPRVERARSAAGPWESVPTAVVQLEDWYLFAARPERGFDRAGFFRLVFESPP
ncbi:MAG: hypothetical protein IT580_12030, partial [Verrucomicrobiales bacterium]|nr:hypothetical protein [Verrucomicrobiales bacterium]